jgi:hypothetical protein
MLYYVKKILNVNIVLGKVHKMYCASLACVLQRAKYCNGISCALSVQ